MKLLVFEDNYADEFDVYGFALYSEEKYNQWIQLLDMLEFPFESYFGTNEEIAWTDKGDLLSKIKIRDISNEDSLVIKNVFPLYYDEYGHFICGYNRLAEYVGMGLSEEDFEKFDKEFCL